MNNVSGRLTLALSLGCFLLCPILWGFSLLTFRNLIFFLMLSFISVSDLTEYKIPNATILTSVSAWTVYEILVLLFGELFKMESDIPFLESLTAAFGFAFGIYFVSAFLRAVLRKKVLGGGDIKLFFVTGLYLGVEKSLYMLFTACIIGLVISFILGRKRKIPFGPAISLATVIIMAVS